MLKNRSKIRNWLTFMALITSCLAANASSLKSPYINEIFTQYGEENGTRISQKRFSDLLSRLTLGNVYIEKLDKFCRYKGIHSGYKEQPERHDEISKAKSTNSFLRKRRSGDHGHNDDQQTEHPNHQQHLQRHIAQCLTKKLLLQNHYLNESSPISKAEFISICPALIQQLNGGFCLHRHNCSGEPYYLQPHVNSNMVWAYGFVAITVVSLASLCIIAVIPCLKKSFYQRIMGYLVALAVGTLAGDALLHLIPHAFQSLLTSEAEHRGSIWKSCFVLLGIYVFFLVEQLMKAKANSCCCSRKSKSQDSLDHRYTKDASRNGEIRFSELSSKSSKDRLHPDSCSCHGSKEDLSDAHESPNPKSETELLTSPHITIIKKHHSNHDPHGHLEYHDHHENPHDLKHDHGHSHGTLDKNTSVATLAWMVIVGDGFHNFSDGLAIGAAFAASYSSGVSTAIAVLCHELPHEIGDFAVLIKSGMTIRQAIFYNMVSAVLSYIGLVIGILVGNYSDDGKQFALALTAGLFLYVALANMLPELTSSMADDAGDLWTFILPHLGIISGIVIMLLISIYEDKF